MIKGSCLCGQFSYEIHGKMGEITHCHCPTCRKAHAAAFSSVAAVQLEDLVITTGEELLKFHESSPGKRRYFCSNCGSHIYAKRDDQNHYIFRMGTIEDDPGTRPGQHIFTRYKAPWYNIHDDIPEYSEWVIETDLDSRAKAKGSQKLFHHIQSALSLAGRKGTATSLLLIHISASEDEHETHDNTTDITSALHGEIRNNIRDSDDLEQISDGVYAVLLPFTDSSAAIILAERICITLKGITQRMGKHLNIGVATLRCNQLHQSVVKDTNEILDMANQALCASKEEAINRVSHFNKLD